MRYPVFLGALALALSATVQVAAAESDNPSGPYVGGGYGRFNLHVDSLSDVGQGFDSIVDSHDDAYKIFAGWRLTPHWAVEAEYVNFGHPQSSFTASGSSGDYRVHLDGFSPKLIGTLPLGPVELFADAGYLFYNVDLNVNVASMGSAGIESSHTRSDFVYGGGLGVVVLDHLAVRAEYERVELADFKDSDALWLTAAWRF